MIKWTIDINELDDMSCQLEGCANALDIIGNAVHGDYESRGVKFIAYSIEQLAQRLEKLMEEAEEVKLVEAGEKNG